MVGSERVTVGPDICVHWYETMSLAGEEFETQIQLHPHYPWYHRLAGPAIGGGPLDLGDAAVLSPRKIHQGRIRRSGRS